MKAIEGGCLCGAIRYRAVGQRTVSRTAIAKLAGGRAALRLSRGRELTRTSSRSSMASLLRTLRL